MEVVPLASGEIPAADPELIIFVSALAENWGTDLILTVRVRFPGERPVVDSSALGG
jgi:hypothetical protein